jgi:acetoin utilization protein AcuB
MGVGMEAAELMTTDVAFVKSTDNVASAVETLAELDVRHLPVVDGGELVGMISDRDLRELGMYQLNDTDDLERIKALGQNSVADVMSGDVQSIEPGTSIGDIIELMISEKVGAVPVVDSHTGNLVGIVSYVDVLRVAADKLD